MSLPKKLAVLFVALALLGGCPPVDPSPEATLPPAADVGDDLTADEPDVEGDGPGDVVDEGQLPDGDEPGDVGEDADDVEDDPDPDDEDADADDGEGEGDADQDNADDATEDEQDEDADDGDEDADDEDEEDGDTGGGGGGGGDVPAPVTLITLDPITFLGDVPAGVNPASYAIAGGSIDFAGGVGRLATTAEEQLAYGFIDDWAWFPETSGVTATVTFTGLDVRELRLYFSDLGAPGAVMTVRDTLGGIVDTVESFTAATTTDTGAQYNIDSSDLSIWRLVIEVPSGVTVSLDEIILTVAQ